MSLSGPRVRDLTGRKRRLSVDVVSGPAFELLASAFVVTMGEDEIKEYEAGPALLERAQGAASPGLLAEMEEVGQGDLWLGFIGLAYESPEPRQVGSFLDYLGAVDAMGVRRGLGAMPGDKQD